MIGNIVKVTVDRPLGSYHPKHKDIYYPINYGYIEGIIAPDGEEQDAYILGVNEPVKEFVGRIIAIIHRFDDVEEKWVVVPEDVSFTKEDWQTINQEGLFNGTKDAVKGVLSDILTGADLNKVPSPKEIIDNGISDLKNNIKVSQYVKGFKQATKSYLSFMSFVSRVRDYLSGQEQKSSIPVLGPYQHFA